MEQYEMRIRTAAVCYASGEWGLMAEVHQPDGSVKTYRGSERFATEALGMAGAVELGKTLREAWIATGSVVKDGPTLKK